MHLHLMLPLPCSRRHDGCPDVAKKNRTVHSSCGGEAFRRRWVSGHGRAWVGRGRCGMRVGPGVGPGRFRSVQLMRWRWGGEHQIWRGCEAGGCGTGLLCCWWWRRSAGSALRFAPGRVYTRGSNRHRERLCWPCGPTGAEGAQGARRGGEEGGGEEVWWPLLRHDGSAPAVVPWCRVFYAPPLRRRDASRAPVRSLALGGGFAKSRLVLPRRPHSARATASITAARGLGSCSGAGEVLARQWRNAGAVLTRYWYHGDTRAAV